MKCATCRKPLGTSDRRRKYCSEFCRVNAKKTGNQATLRVLTESDLPSEEPRAPLDETAEPREGLTIGEAAREGTALEVRIALRNRIAEQLDDATLPPRELASLSKRLVEVDGEVREMTIRLREEPKKHGSAVDDERFDQAAI